MKNEEFHKILSNEFEKIIKEDFSKDKSAKLKQEQQRHSHAFLIWFMKFYGGMDNVEKYITDGHGDNSCDIILDRTNSQGEKTFYLVQSKWNSVKNCNGDFDSTELKSYLSDVHSILLGDKEETENELFNIRYRELLEHVRSNGRVRVIYLTLRNNCTEAEGNIKSTEKAIGGDIKIEGLDINRLKIDYIERIYKKSNPPNPLDHIYNPEFEKVLITVSRDEPSSHIIVSKPFEAHVFIVQPSLIYGLVKRYGVSLFDKNIRNPMKSSSINMEIRSTLKNNSPYFWYYNNGITAISRQIPRISNQASSFEVTGLQIINGAQTAFAIYNAFEEATKEEREIIDSEARITLRLLKSGGKDFDLRVTKYTNSQNPVTDRDFWSNDEIQERIQNYFYETNIWYEKKSGEFREEPEGIIAVPNTFVACAYLAFWLNDPVAVLNSRALLESEGPDLIFTSHKDNKEGLYETIFNNDSNLEAMLASFCMLDTIKYGRGFEIESIFYTNAFHILALSRIILEKYLTAKYDQSIKIEKFIYKKYKENDIEILLKVITHATRVMKEALETANSEEEENELIRNIMSKKHHFEMLSEKLKKSEISVLEIESIKLILSSDLDSNTSTESS